MPPMPSVTAPTKTSKRGDGLLLLAFLLSGAAGLGYEILWTRLLGIALGSEILAIFGVLAGFFLGLAIGAFALQHRARRSRNPLRLFAILESLAAVYALASPFLLSRLATASSALGSGENSGVALLRAVAISATTLLPATICLGGTLAAIVEARRRARPHEVSGRSIGRLYGANTLGAMAGTLAAIYLILPTVGFTLGAVLLALLGFGAAAVAILWGRSVNMAKTTTTGVARAPTTSPSPSPETVPSATAVPRWALLVLIFGTGLVGVGFEAVGVKVLAQGLENTIFSFANILAVYLAGTAVGAWSYARLAPRLTTARFPATLGALLFALAVAVILAAIPLRYSAQIVAAVAPPHTSYLRHLLGEWVIALAVFTVPTILMGALFSHIVGALSENATGYAYGLNTLGATAAPFVFGLLAIPKMHYTGAYYLVAYAYLALLAFHLITSRGRLLWIPIAIFLIVGLDFSAPTSLSLVTPPPGWKLLDRKEGLFGAVLVIERAGLSKAEGKLQRRLQVGQRFRMGGLRAFAEHRMGHMPLLMAQHRQRSLFLGVGTGATLGATRAYPISRVDAVELVPEILTALPYFSAINANISRDPSVHFHAGDARRFVASAKQRWNLIVADLFHPARDGAANLFSLEHFRILREKLEPGGIFVQWIPLYQFATVDLRLVIRTFLAAFPEADSFLGIYNAKTPILAIVGYRPGSGSKKAFHIGLARLTREISHAGRDRYVQNYRDLLGTYLLDHAALTRFAHRGPLNTDLTPRLTFSAAHAAYENRSRLAWESLAAIWPLRVPCPPRLFDAPQEAQAKAKVAISRWARAVDLYMRADLQRVQAKTIHYPPGAVSKLLDAYDVEPSFSPARGLLLKIAAANGPEADRIFQRLIARTPDNLRVQGTYAQSLLRRGKTREALEIQKKIQQAIQAQPPHRTPK